MRLVRSTKGKTYRFFLQNLGMMIGFAIMVLLSLFEDDIMNLWCEIKKKQFQNPKTWQIDQWQQKGDKERPYLTLRTVWFTIRATVHFRRCWWGSFKNKGRLFWVSWKAISRRSTLNQASMKMTFTSISVFVLCSFIFQEFYKVEAVL